MNKSQYWFLSVVIGFGFAMMAVVFSGCGTAQKMESPEWHYNMGRQDALKEMGQSIEQANLYIAGVNEARTQCEARLQECLEAGREK